MMKKRRKKKTKENKNKNYNKILSNQLLIKDN